MYDDCRDCAGYKGDCGYHHIDSNKHICYEIPNETMMMNSLGSHGSCFVPSDKYIEEENEKMVKEILSKYSKGSIKKAFNKITEEENI